ncbi:hypothetical protein, conserved [Plasmodium gonderi]|uniref:C2H2-type domain-containing protein n=1 Tax=Plasmodium gonderi TaxID=77519 RepID=A0A1Y1JIS3_PLAGO|nr:hypothetical protein, conserved [Plasmodium gonderi]GAW82396.1 hypothetical protein, conserved [Plasmodium gonderi]
MKEPNDEKTNERKRKKPDCNAEESKESSKSKKKIEFENDDEFEKYLLDNFKKSYDQAGETWNNSKTERLYESRNESEYSLSDMIKSFYNEVKKYKTVDDMANEIKKLATQNIKKNLDIICNNECTSSFFVEKYRVKYMNEQTELNIKSAQNYFKEFMILYNNNNFDDFSLEINTNLEKNSVEENIVEEGEKRKKGDETDDDTENDTAEKNAKAKIMQNGNGENDDDKSKESSSKKKKEGKNKHPPNEMYTTDIWKEKIKCKIENINENTNILIKIVNYLANTSLHIDHVPLNIKKFDILKKLNELDYDILNANIWDTYSSKETRPFSLSISSSPSFYRKANIYFKKHNKTNDILNTLREKPLSVYIKGWYLSNLKRNNYNYLDLRICPPICSHIEIIKMDYENAKTLVRKLDTSCHIDLDLQHRLGEEVHFESMHKKRKIDEESHTHDVESTNEKQTLPVDQNCDNINKNRNNTNIVCNNELSESPIIQIIEENKKLSIMNKLDILVLYLRFVHNFCYYSARKFNTYDEMTRECGHFYLRVNMENKFYKNLIPIFYENFNIKKLEHYVHEDFGYSNSNTENYVIGENSTIGNTYKDRTNSGNNDNTLEEENCGMEEGRGDIVNQTTKPNRENGDYFNLCRLKNTYLNDLDEVSDYQLKWLLNFETEIKDAIKANYNEHIEIEKTKEFLEILKNNYILKPTHNNSTNTDGKSEIRCAKCKKLFNNIKDVPNHIFIKHNQVKMKLITEAEAQIMKKCFYESPHSFQFLFMMEKKYNSNHSKNYLNKSIFKKTKNYKNHNFHVLPNSVKSDYKDFDDPTLNVFENVKQTERKKNDFYDDT